MNLFYFNINKICNNSCSFCAAEIDNNENIMHKKSNISFFKFKKIFETLTFKKGDKIIINGGEPTLNSDLVKILTFCNSVCARIILFTNGRKLSDMSYAEQIIKRNIEKISIPLHGHNALLHDRITRKQNSFTETTLALNNISFLKKSYKFYIELKILICEDNYSHIKNIAELFFNNFKFDTLLLSGLIPSKIAQKNKQIVSKEKHMLSVNKFLDGYFLSNNKLPDLLIDGIPMCHLNDKNRLFYLFYRMKKKFPENETQDNIFLIDTDLDGSITISDIKNTWNDAVCYKTDCKYLTVCRLNTLIYSKEFLKGWINE
ncbi:MAG: radical SAM protein [Bacteroidales bacterium]|jgi:MoaA/NifB/PqqE/SkfB family radical SAM enzyme|nr:radical SAM protein [Bacteroidales bacterium]